jgi:hypothetical protein
LLAALSPSAGLPDKGPLARLLGNL